MAWFWAHYLGEPLDAVRARALSPQAVPLRAPDLRALPPALVLTAWGLTAAVLGVITTMGSIVRSFLR